jgi:predicted AAA+ superfamily ATPase
MKSVSDSLAGRTQVLALEPLSWTEVSRALPSVPIEQYLVRGGFPELYEKPDLDASAFHRSYLATYLERDLRQMLQVTSLRDFERFVRACALRSAQLLNRAELARDVGISGPTAAGWLSALQAAGLAVLLEPWFSNRTRSLVKSPKLYLADTGLAAFLCGLRATEELSESPFAGPLWESLVFAELRRRQLNAHGGWELNFWRDRVREADFLRHRGGVFHLADAKWTERPDARDAAALERVAQALPERSVRSRTIFCRAAHSYPLDRVAVASPVSEPGEGWL